ncbi:PAS domain-containing sensor histidine kinase [Sinorhizobium sp. BG8]|uniref:PAS domain-containing sensor histidine kinase n=1 Tax=Sinorhizobium sp. BG8 TaxID=2613773 RepID=UPI00193D811A|nr:PAS domain-containing sensor histidine kinase [Sinorhizobium sp. BG8]QRM55227.1 PAS domain-containing protein [Sinorhizobium sp. BG8]
MSNNEAPTNENAPSREIRNGGELALLETIPGHVWSTDPVGRFTFRNRSMESFFGGGFPRDLGDWLERVHTDDQRPVAETWQASIDTGQPLESAHRLCGIDDKYRWFRVSGRPVRDVFGHILAWHGQTIDIEDEKRAAEELRARSIELSLLVDIVPSHVWLMAPEGTTTTVNKHMADFLGLDLSNAGNVEAVMETIFHPDDSEPVRSELGRCLATGESFSMSYRLLRADDTFRWMLGRVEPIRDKDGNIVQWFGLCHDIEDQVQAAAALRRSAEQLAHAARAANLSQLAASIAHEINQPLTAVVTDSEVCVRWLSADPPNVERGKQAAERVTQDALSALDIVGRIRALFRRQPQTRTMEDINRLVTEVVALMSDEFSANMTRVDMELGVHLPTVALDRIQVQQVLVNLIRNGIQAMDGTNPARALKIKSTCDPANAILVSVEDAGTGFTHPDRVFEPFFTTKSNGMGMGLPICRSIVEAHGGRLWVENNLTGGATVSFTLPATET